jgi:hypothetical protein
VGVACHTPNSIACDRVGVAVWLRRPAARVAVTVNGLGVRLRLTSRGSGSGWWEGFLQPAGLLDGPLRVTPDHGRYYWQGFHPRNVHVVVKITRAVGNVDRASATVPLGPGWG